MVLNLMRLAALLCVALLLAVSPPGYAHKKHQDDLAAQQAAAQAAQAERSGRPSPPAAGGMGDTMAGHETAMEEPPATFFGRLFGWMGRMHPFAVHFPIALFPISWLALIIARRRGDTVDVIRAFIIIAGVAAVGAGVLGWLNAGFTLSDRDPVQFAHRWLGTLLAAIGGILAWWTWRRASSINGAPMVWALGLVTLLLLIQGWLGGAITHGMEHMMF